MDVYFAKKSKHMSLAVLSGMQLLLHTSETSGTTSHAILWLRGKQPAVPQQKHVTCGVLRKEHVCFSAVHSAASPDKFQAVVFLALFHVCTIRPES
jgi:hypothetical protein